MGVLQNKKVLEEILLKHGIDQYAFANLQNSGKFRECSATIRLNDFLLENKKSVYKSVIMLLFPYKKSNVSSSLSHYAKIPDYHGLVKKVLDEICESVQNELDVGCTAFVDNSPFYEVSLATKLGLGCAGEHGLVINKKHGSWVFVATIVVDAETAPDKTEVTHCLKCGECIKSCPSGALLKKDMSVCLSHLTQKKKISEEEEKLIKLGKSVWGCDICQSVCPLNRGTKNLAHLCFDGEFAENYHPKDEYLQQRAWDWRGRNVVDRNYQLIYGLRS